MRLAGAGLALICELVMWASTALLPPGSYTISVSKAGFGTQTRKDVELLVNQNLTLDITLTPSSVEQTIEVTGLAPVLETTTGTIGKVIQGETIVDLPLNGRKFTQLVQLTPGAAPRQGGQQTVSQSAKEQAASAPP